MASKLHTVFSIVASYVSNDGQFSLGNCHDFFQNQLAICHTLVDTFTRRTIYIETLNSLINEVLNQGTCTFWTYFSLIIITCVEGWNDISAAAPNTDYVIYNIPQLAGVALTPSLYTEMLKNPRVIGVKNSSMPVQDIQTFVSLGGEDHIVFNGPDEQFLGGRLMGAKAGIGGTYGAMPELFLKLNELIAEKDLETARELQYAINAIIGKLTSAHGNMYGVIKEVLKINEGLNIGSVRSPLTPVTEEERPVVEAAAQLIRETKERFL